LHHSGCARFTADECIGFEARLSIMAKRIAILLHKNESRFSLPRFAIWHLAQVWREEDIRVIFLFGIKKFVPADLAILHVDLTVVPEPYIEFAHRYPLVLNGNSRDIRKSTFSRHMVKAGDGYEGPVLVKSELNYGGAPERKLLGSFASRLSMRITTRFSSLRSGSQKSKVLFRSPMDYRIFDNICAVPENWRKRDDILIEQFLPEREDGLYCLRNYHFLGRHGVCVLRRAPSPIVNISTVIDRREVEPAAEIVEAASKIGLDFGKLDYVLHDGRPVLLDVNKTPGAGKSASYPAMSRVWAKGIKQYL
jgi:hypothetical protein